jgi:hypothetical protein
VMMIGAERPDTKAEPDPRAEVILGVDTHTSMSTWRWPWTIWVDAWASPACQRPLGATRGSSAGRRILAP